MSRAWLPKLGLEEREENEGRGAAVVLFWAMSCAGPIEGGM